jgi:hypothetical protein
MKRQPNVTKDGKINWGPLCPIIELKVDRQSIPYLLHLHIRRYNNSIKERVIAITYIFRRGNAISGAP